MKWRYSQISAWLTHSLFVCKTCLMWPWCMMIVTCQVIPSDVPSFYRVDHWLQTDSNSVWVFESNTHSRREHCSPLHCFLTWQSHFIPGFHSHSIHPSLLLGGDARLEVEVETSLCWRISSGEGALLCFALLEKGGWEEAEADAAAALISFSFLILNLCFPPSSLKTFSLNIIIIIILGANNWIPSLFFPKSTCKHLFRSARPGIVGYF